MKPWILVLAFMLMFSIQSYSPKMNKNLGDGQFLKVLTSIQKARKSLSSGSFGEAKRIANKAIKAYPYNRVIYDEVWRIYIICEDYKSATKITKHYLHHLKDRKGDESVVKDYCFVQYRFEICKTINTLQKKKYRNADFNGIKRNLQILQRRNTYVHFLSINDALEINNLIGVLTFLSKGKSRHYRKDVLHSHISQKTVQEAYNFFNMADSLNTLFELEYQDVDSNRVECNYWSSDFFSKVLGDKDDLSIPSLLDHLGLSKKAEEDIVASTSSMKDSILKVYDEPVAYLECFSDVLSKLGEFKEFHFVFDHSGSMGDISSEEGALAGMTRHRVMQEAGNYLILNLVEQGLTTIDAISVGSNCEDDPSINTYLESHNFKKKEEKIFYTMDWLAESESYGATPLYETFNTLQQSVPATKKKKAILLFSDGVNSCDIDDGFQTDNDRLIEIKNQLRRKNAEIFVMALIPQEGYEAEFSVYKELAGRSDRIWQFTENCEKVEVSTYDFRLNFFMPPMEGCASHTLRSDSVCFDWVDLKGLFQVDFDLSEGEEESP